MSGRKDPVLTVVETNSADDSKGIAFGLSGNLFLPVAASAVVSLGLVTILLWKHATSVPVAIFAGSVPLLATLAIVIGFFQNRPPHYAADLLESLTTDESFVRHPFAQPPHPAKRSILKTQN
ncbi:MAG: hypothetical protein V4726_00120 [Verrucomicrobiota bacterium]